MRPRDDTGILSAQRSLMLAQHLYSNTSKCNSNATAPFSSTFSSTITTTSSQETVAYGGDSATSQPTIEFSLYVPDKSAAEHPESFSFSWMQCEYL